MVICEMYICVLGNNDDCFEIICFIYSDTIVICAYELNWHMWVAFEGHTSFWYITLLYHVSCHMILMVP